MHAASHVFGQCAKIRDIILSFRNLSNVIYALRGDPSSAGTFSKALHEQAHVIGKLLVTVKASTIS
jgi:hypothetical protein